MKHIELISQDVNPGLYIPKVLYITQLSILNKHGWAGASWHLSRLAVFQLPLGTH